MAHFLTSDEEASSLLSPPLSAFDSIDDNRCDVAKVVITSQFANSARS